MAENTLKVVPAIASGAVTKKRFGKYDANGKVAQCGTSGEDADGVIRDTATDGFAIGLTIGPADPVEIEAGAAITAGSIVQTDANGKAITQTTGKGLGRAQTASAADGDVIEVQLFAHAYNQQAANADTSGATLGNLEIEVNELKASLRKAGIIAP